MERSREAAVHRGKSSLGMRQLGENLMNGERDSHELFQHRKTVTSTKKSAMSDSCVQSRQDAGICGPLGGAVGTRIWRTAFQI